MNHSTEGPPSRKGRWLLLLLMMATCLNWACTSRTNLLDPKPLTIFAGFTYVGDAPYSEDASTQTVVPPHGEVELPLPKQLSVGKQYIFHHRRPMDDENLALAIFPATFRALGLHVTAAPKSPADLMALTYGGPLFRIQFDDGHHNEYVFNRLCPRLMGAEKGGGQWVEEDYVLAIPVQR